jgi:hypothetical protein
MKTLRRSRSAMTAATRSMSSPVASVAVETPWMARDLEAVAAAEVGEGVVGGDEHAAALGTAFARCWT